MLDWGVRALPLFGTAFSARSQKAVHLLLPPGTSLGAEPEPASVAGRGLWRHAYWRRGGEEPMVDVDPPAAVRRIRTVEVLDLVGDRLHAEVSRVMAGQFAQVRLVAPRPSPGGFLHDREAQYTAALATRLTLEAQEAFPAESFWRLDGALALPDDYVAFLRFEAPSAYDRELRVRDILQALVTALLHKIRKRPGLTPAQLCPACAEDSAGQHAADLVAARDAG